MAAAHVVVHLADDAFLRACEGERQHLAVELVEVLAHGGEDESRRFVAGALHVAQDVDLQGKQFLIFHAELRLLQLAVVGGDVHGPERVGQWHEQPRVAHRGWQRVAHLCRSGVLQQGGHEFVDSPRAHTSRMHALGEAIHALQSLCGLVGLVDVNLGMDDAVTVLVLGGFAKDDVFHTGLVVVLDVAQAVEPHHLDAAGAVAE